MKCHYCERDAVTVIGEHRKRHVCEPCAAACAEATAYVESIYTPEVLDRIFNGSPEPQTSTQEGK